MSTAFPAKYFAHELTKRCPSDSIQKLAATLADAQVDLNPHQIDAALFAFLSPLSKGALLADEVGLGKTIEAGILLSQKWAERKRKLLVIVPANLRKQWNQELTDKFFLSSAILETRTFNEQIRRGNLNPFNHPEIVICSYHFACAKDVYIQQVRWDLIIIDEAHRLRNVYKPANRIANAIKNAVAPFPKVLLTALKRGFAAATDKGAQKKAIIFTESTRTQEYLRALLEKTEYAGRIVLFNGSNTDAKSKEIYRAWLRKHDGTDRVTGSPSADMRAALVDYFRDEAIVMVATEAAAEGINLQFCSLVVNYDLPWNPQRIEQRIGRCHRYGQKCDVVVVNFLNKANSTDQRVYQLLDEKFKLFSGVFGASDEVLGAIESGVDFEKRIVQIYQTCRTPEQIEFNFNALQKELEQQIDETMQQTRQKLLENFDEEVHEKLKIKDRESSDYLTRFDNWLWQLTRYYLKPYAQFEDGKNAFILTRNPFPEENIHPGPYRSGRNARLQAGQVEDANLYRVGHPLAQRIIQQCKALAPAPAELAFSYTGSGKTITILEPLIGKAGWLCLASVTVSSFDTEDWLLFAGLTDGGQDLDPDQCQRMFSLANTETPQLNLAASGSVRPRLETKVALRKRAKKLEARRSEKRRGLFEAQDAVDARKDALLTEVEARLKQTVTRTELFTVRWKVE